jgi:hypothetical protein
VENTNGTINLEELMTDEQLQTTITQYKDNASVVAYLQGIVTKRAAIAEANKIKSDFEEKINKMAGKIVFPAGILNVLIRNTEVELPDANDASKMVKVWKTQIIVNHACNIDKKTTSNTTSNTTSTKRGITVSKRNGQQLETLGNFRSGAEFDRHMKLDYTNQSPMLILRKAGYIADEYDGADFLIKA